VPPARPAAPNPATTTPGAAPAVIDLRRERTPQRQVPAPQATTTLTPPSGAQGAVAPPHPPAGAQTPPPAQSAAPARRPQEPGVDPERRGRPQTGPSLPAPVRVEPPRQAVPQPMSRPPMPQQPPAAREVQRVPQPEQRGEPEGKVRAPDSRSNNPRTQMQ
jgi:hypothetical protein